HLTCFYWSARLCLEGLAADRPAAPAVTAYFSWIGLGGLCGGLFQIVIAPYLFRDYLEYTFLAALACMLRPAWLTNGLTDWLLGLIVLPRAEPTAPPTRGRRLMALGFDLGLAFVVCVLAVGLFLLRMRHGNEGRPLGNTPRILVDWPLILALFIAVPLIARPIRFGLALAAIVAWCWIGKDLFGVETVVFRDRNLLGTVRVVEDKSSMRIIDPLPGEVVRDPMIHRRLMQGTTDQGGCIADPTALARYPTAYYHRKGPVGVVMRHLDMYSGPPQTNWSDVRIAAALVGQGVPLGVGNLPLNAIGCAWSEPPYAIVGLGAGTSFAYAHPYQWVDAYEIDPIVVKLSTRPTPLFHHFQAARKRGVAANIYQGDGRRLLSKQRNDGFYHVMFIDAMNSDAFPVHLFTEEAIQLYFQKLAPKGVLMVHASNRHVDLPPKLAGTAAKLGFASLAMRDHEPDRQRLEYSSHWVAIARNAETIERWTRHEPELDQRLEIQPINVRGLGWTDEHASVAASLHPRQGWFEFLLGVLIVLLAFGAVLGLVEMIIAMLPETPRSQTPFGNEGGERNFGYQQRGTQTYV
ncbi:MAG TPA: hypothetical protein VFE62_28550, partial [Gemmataceae bacterium]|nr:hypothetical protein [Gemmataceae bacterium]